MSALISTPSTWNQRHTIIIDKTNDILRIVCQIIFF